MIKLKEKEKSKNISFEEMPCIMAELVDEVSGLRKMMLDFKKSSVKETVQMGINETCQMTGYKKSTLYQLVSDNKIPYHKPEHGGRKLIFLRAEIENWLKGKKTETSEEYCGRKELELFNSMNGGLN
ncbi:MAG: helix-turn-helix domain-containing protein [Bacteroidales bacterium]|nr:helix-turn-helix domain-containing protein [Bacteroidales bacterium]